MTVRRISRAASRAQHYVETIAEAESGRAAMVQAYNWWLKELSEVAEDRPQKADAACWVMARLLAGWAARLSKARIGRQAGLTRQEQHELLHPWDTPQEGGKQ